MYVVVVDGEVELVISYCLRSGEIRLTHLRYESTIENDVAFVGTNSLQ